MSRVVVCSYVYTDVKNVVKSFVLVTLAVYVFNAFLLFFNVLFIKTLIKM